MDKHDRHAINSVVVYSSGVPANSRATMNREPWNNAPTPITPGQNRSLNKPKASSGQTPWSANRLTTNLHKSPAPPGNPVSKRTLIQSSQERPQKRRKLGPHQSSVEVENPRHVFSASRDVIDVEQEDIGRPVMSRRLSSPDPINAFEEHSKTAQVVPDGRNTLLIREKVAKKSQPIDISEGDDVQPITDSAFRPSIPTSSSRPQGPKVLKLVARLEERKKDQMRGNSAKNKQGLQGTRPHSQKDPIATSTTPFKNKNRLPVEAWFMGLTRHPSEDNGMNPPYFLSWESRELTLTRGPLGQPSSHIVRITISQHVESAVYSHENTLQGSLVLQLRIGFPGQRGIPRSWKDRGSKIQPGSRGADGLITIKFLAGHPMLSRATYQSFILWLKGQFMVGCKPAVVDLHGANVLWSAAGTASDFCSQTKSLRARETNTEPNFAPLISKHFPKTNKAQSATTSDAALECPSEIDLQLKRDSGLPSQKPNTKAIPTASSSFPNFLNRSNPKPVNESALDTVATPVLQNAKLSPSSDPDEVILVFPPDSLGAVNITNADLNRLRPGEFLNDTLIEFGLKLWLNDLRIKDSQFAESIHVFSSFFYKKLNTKNLEEGYKSIRKWTSKIDIFKKKYIIVPINENLHWYLAIIYHPEHILRSPPVTKQLPTVYVRPATRASLEVLPEPVNVDQPGPQKEPSASDPHLATTSETSTEDGVEALTNFTTSCSISIDNQGSDPQPASPLGNHNEISLAESQPAVIDDVDDGLVSRQSSISDFSSSEGVTRPVLRDDKRHSLSDDPFTSHFLPSKNYAPDGSTEPVAIFPGPLPANASKIDSAVSNDLGSTGQQDEDIVMVDVPALGEGAINPEQFYSSTPSKGKRKAAPFPIELRGEEEEVGELLLGPGSGSQDELPITYIFTLDSLGSRHPQAIRILSNYLKLEAKDKRGIEEISPAVGKQALVPVQPNYCDCGVYLLHLAETFMSDPAHYCHTILNSRASTISARRVEWKDENVGGLREKLTGRIIDLSEKWQKERVAKEEQRKKEVAEGKEVDEESEGEIDILPGTTTAKSPQKRPKTKASRIRG